MSKILNQNMFKKKTVVYKFLRSVCFFFHVCLFVLFVLMLKSEAFGLVKAFLRFLKCRNR